MVVVLGDNARSTDSRSWGFLSADQVLGAVIRRFPDGRR
ncbi:MAG: S26 family signal peptidase [Trebonia sp.]